MYCARCSQQQVSEETKFCSRCGFPLGLVSEVLAHGGFLPQLAELHKSKRRLTRRNGVVFSIFWMMFFLLIMASFFSIIDVEKLAAVSAVIGIFGGLMLLIASLVFFKRESNEAFAPMYGLSNADLKKFDKVNQRHLPPQQTQPAQSYSPPAGTWKAPETGDFAQPRSVTENTTRLLRKEDE